MATQTTMLPCQLGLVMTIALLSGGLPMALTAHVSDGCGGSLWPRPPGSSVDMNYTVGVPLLRSMLVPDPLAGPSGKANRTYWVVLPKQYKPAIPSKVVVMLHGYFDLSVDPTAHDAGDDELRNDGLVDYISNNSLNVIAVFPVGSGPGEGAGDVYSWNTPANGLNLSPGPDGKTCRTPRHGDDIYPCFSTCSKKGQRGCDSVHGCNFASCLDDISFLRLLMPTIMSSFCVDLTHIHMAGFSTGGVMTYHLGATLPSLSSIAVVEGGQILGFPSVPVKGVQVLDVHGQRDATMPANISCGSEGPCGPGPHNSLVTVDDFYMIPLSNITATWTKSAGCTPAGPTTYVTSASPNISCVYPHGDRCQNGTMIVTCTGNWSHDWPLHRSDPKAYPSLLLEFFDRTPGSSVQMPPFVTPKQADSLKRISSTARAESEAAFDSAVQLLDRSSFRTLLAQADPALANIPSETLLLCWQQQLSIAEIAHGVAARQPDSQLDSPAIFDPSWEIFPNQWQLPMLHSDFGTSLWRFLSYYPEEDSMEVDWLGLPSFSSVSNYWTNGYPSSLDEASNRLIYAVLNQNRHTLPAYRWGDISFVFNRSGFLHSSVVLSPVDTGDWRIQCKKSVGEKICSVWESETACTQVWGCGWSNEYNCCDAVFKNSTKSPFLNCSVLEDIKPGTLDYAVHLLEPFARAYGDEFVDVRLADLIAASLAPGYLTPGRYFQPNGVPLYFEADIVGNVPLPSGISLVVLDIASLFGTNLGELIQRLALVRDWPIVWSATLSSDFCTNHTSGTRGGRVLDPVVLENKPNLLNVSITSIYSQRELFEDMWQTIKAQRVGDNPLSCDAVEKLWANMASLLSPNLMVMPIVLKTCENVDSCIGMVKHSNECICRL